MAKWRIIDDATGATVAEFGDSGELSCASIATNALSATSVVGTGALTGASAKIAGLAACGSVTANTSVGCATVTATGFVKSSDKFIFAANNGVSQTIAINCASDAVVTLRFEGGILTANTVA
jgi:hypothetical protein